MDQLDPTQVAARELLAVAQDFGLDFRPLWKDWVFASEGRHIYFWTEGGKWHYTLEGETSGVPTCQSANDSTYISYWGESGIVAGIEAAIRLLQAWLSDRVDVIALPDRQTISHGTG